MMERPPDQPVCAELPAQCHQFPVPPAAQDRLRDSERSAQSRHDSADRRHLHLCRRITYQIYLAISDAPTHRHPTTIDRYARPLPFERLHVSLLEKPRKTLLRVAAFLADDSERASLGGLWDQPIKVWRIVRNEPNAGGVRRMILWQANDGLHERHRFDGRPAGAASHAAGSAVRSDYAIRMQFLALPRRIDFHAQAAPVRNESQKACIKRE